VEVLGLSLDHPPELGQRPVPSIMQRRAECIGRSPPPQWPREPETHGARPQAGTGVAQAAVAGLGGPGGREEEDEEEDEEDDDDDDDDDDLMT
jgi:hypothetical protein